MTHNFHRQAVMTHNFHRPQIMTHNFHRRTVVPLTMFIGADWLTSTHTAHLPYDGLRRSPSLKLFKIIGPLALQPYSLAVCTQKNTYSPQPFWLQLLSSSFYLFFRSGHSCFLVSSPVLALTGSSQLRLAHASAPKQDSYQCPSLDWCVCVSS